MKVLIAILSLLFLVSCEKNYYVKSTTIVKEVVQGYMCVEQYGVEPITIRICDTKEECADYCDLKRKENTHNL